MEALKKIKFSLTFAMVFLALTAFSCSNNNNNDDNPVIVPPNNNFVDLVNTVNNGTWRISYFYDNDQDETINFNGYVFTFGSNNALTATNATNTYTGIWSITDSNSNDDSLNDLHFNIAFTSPAQFEELSDDWEIQSKSATVISLIDVSGGNGGTDFLTFTKN